MTKLSIHLEKMIFKAKRFLKKEYNKIIYIVKLFNNENKINCTCTITHFEV